MDKLQTLAPKIVDIIIDKGTELPGTGQYHQFSGQGSYLCRQCGLALFRSDDKFLSSCGWPSFDEEITGTIKRSPDPDGIRTKISCQRCDAHLGHVFIGEGHTTKNMRHCVNSLAIDFVLDTKVVDTEEVIYAGGCFWGVQHLLDQEAGVLKTEVGYSGGHLDSPTYEVVCGGKSGHLEAVRVIYDSAHTNYETLTRFFLEIHDPSQVNRQGPDIGEQYSSAIFYFNDQQHAIANHLLEELKSLGINPQTQLIEATVFWPAEEHHQHYYQKTGKQPYCHVRTKRFKEK